MKALLLAVALSAIVFSPALAQTAPSPTRPVQTAVDYTSLMTPENTAVLFIDNQSGLILGVQSMDHTVLVRNTEALAKLTKLFNLPVVLTTTGGGANGPAGPLMPSITQTFPDTPVIDRQMYFNAMDDAAFAQAVRALGKKNLILSGISTDYCLIYPAASLIREGYHVFIVTDTSGSWTDQIELAAQSRLVQMGATLTNVQSIAGELQNALAASGADRARANQQGLLAWFSEYGAAPSLLLLPFAGRLGNAN